MPNVIFRTKSVNKLYGFRGFLFLLTFANTLFNTSSHTDVTYNDIAANTAVCRCLARIASSVALASQSSIRSGKMGRAADGLLEVLLQGAAHPSIHVWGICLEAIPSLIVPGSA